MQPLAVLWFQLQMAEQSLREKNFAQAKTEPIGISSPHRASVKQILQIESAREPRAGVSPSRNLFRVIGSRFGKVGSDKAEKLPRNQRAPR
jgi:hypothetical protein